MKKEKKEKEKEKEEEEEGTARTATSVLPIHHRPMRRSLFGFASVCPIRKYLFINNNIICYR